MQQRQQKIRRILAAAIPAALITALNFMLLPWFASTSEPEQIEMSSPFSVAQNFDSTPETTEASPQPPAPEPITEDMLEPPPPIISEPLTWTPPPPIEKPLIKTSPEQPPPIENPTQPPPKQSQQPKTVNETAERSPAQSTSTNTDATQSDDSTTGGDGEKHQPNPVHTPKPPYPRMARYRGIEGHVDVQILVNPNGAVEKVDIIESKPAGMFEATVMKTLMTWRFSSAPSNQGASAPSIIKTRIVFKLR